MPRISHDTLTDLVRDIFVASGCSREESGRIAKYLVGANLAGHDSHGVARVPRYVQWKRDGILRADQKVERVIDNPAIAILDGKFGFGQTVAPQAVAIGVEKCKAMGLSAIGLRNSGHVGRVGEWAEMAAAAGLVSLHFVNVVGSVLVASQGGKELPDNALVGQDGQISGDPHVLYGDYAENAQRDYKKGSGAIRAFGEHKGSGLALMCELLGGALSGNGASAFDRKWSQGMFSFYVDPAKIDPQHFFPAEVARCLSFVKSSKPIAPGGEVLVPGEPESRMRRERRANGVPLPDETWAALLNTARAAGLNSRRLQSIEVA